ncbi:S1C family serine protease [Prosthecobacter sp.]|uniref:S1C family serine protease n=1 Tax=Prosthecobacter sp. TaxID=1965333 RepID=UPI0037851EC9
MPTAFHHASRALASAILLALALLIHLQPPASVHALESARVPRNPYAPPPSARTPTLPTAAATTPSTLLASTPGATPDPLGEWYAVGHRMAQEAMPYYRTFAVAEKDIGKRLTEVLSALGIKADTQLKNTELKLLQQGWDDAAAGRALALTYPPDQDRSIVPPALRGFFRFGKSSPGAGVETLADKAAEWKKAVVKVATGSEKGVEGHGTGFIIGPGLVLTNNHVVDGSTHFAVQLEADNTIYDATLIAKQAVPDVALLRVQLPEDHAVLPIGISAQCRELEEVIMVGYPQFIELSATYVKGSISSTNRVFHDCEVLQLDIRANPGNSGGPVISTEGNVVGILTFGFGAVDPKLAQFTFAIKTDTVIPFLEQHARGQYSRQVE